MAKPLSANLDLIAARMKAASSLFVFSDFDGTLVPIHDRPSDCYLDPETRRTLTLLASQPQLTLGIVSGRELADLKPRVGIDDIIYAGNHGLEIEGPDLAFREPDALALIPIIQALSHNLESELAGMDGVLIENKNLSVSIHYRKVASNSLPQLIDTTTRVVESAVDANQVVLKQGKMVLEIRPAVNWHKGNAVKWLISKLSTGSEPLTIYIGDDETDEDAFYVFQDQVTICVGNRRTTMANYATVDHLDVLAFLAWLLGIAIGKK